MSVFRLAPLPGSGKAESRNSNSEAGEFRVGRCRVRWYPSSGSFLLNLELTRNLNETVILMEPMLADVAKLSKGAQKI